MISLNVLGAGNQTPPTPNQGESKRERAAASSINQNNNGGIPVE